MMYVRLLLMKIRQTYYNSEKWAKYKPKGIAAMAILVVASILLDALIPFNPFTNLIRGAVAIALGFIVYTFLYIYSLNRTRAKADDYDYAPLRKKFSYEQRKNLSYLAGGIVFALTLVSSGESLFFTLSSSISIAMIIAILAFVRTSREEFIMAEYKVKDPRDLANLEKRSKLKEFDKSEG